MTAGRESACQACLLWRTQFRHHRDEAADYRAFRPCKDALRPRFQGRQALSMSGRLLTAPDARCDHWVKRGGESDGH